MAGRHALVNHTHPAGSIDVGWDDISDKPATFPPSAHIHPISDVTGLQAELDFKAPLASPIFTGDPQAPTPAIADNDTSVATTAFVKTAIASTANQTYYFDPTDDADVGGYKKLLLAPSSGAQSTVPVACTGTSDVLIGSFITDPGVPGAVDYPAGSAYRRLYGSVSTGVARFHLQIYSRTAGGVETLARDEFSQNFSNTSPALIEWLATPTGASLSATDRIVVKVYAQRVSGAASITVTFYAEGSANASQIQTTIALGASAPISATPPLSLSGGNLSMPAATSSVNGYLTSASWTTFNAKEPPIAAGTVGQYWRGDKTFQTLNAAAVGLGNVSNVAQVTSVTGTAPVVSSGGTTPAISMPAATGSVNGYLTSANWTTFNAKEPPITAGTVGQYWRGDKSWQTLDKAAVGLSNVDNTSDAAKPVSTAQAAADALRVLKIGDTITGTLVITPTGGATPGIAVYAAGVPHANSGFIHVRPDAGQKGYISFTESGVASRWAIGIDNGVADFNFRVTDATQTIRASLSSAGMFTAQSVNVAGNAPPANGIYLPAANAPALTSNSTLMFQWAQAGGLGRASAFDYLVVGLHNIISMKGPSTSGTFTFIDFANSALTQCGAINVNQSGLTTAYGTSSDGRGKQVRSPLEDARAIIDRLKVYDHTAEGNAIRGVGVVAQEAYQVIPAMVEPGDDGEAWTPEEPGFQMWQADYSKAVPYLIAALQEAFREIDALKAARSSARGGKR